VSGNNSPSMRARKMFAWTLTGALLFSTISGARVAVAEIDPAEQAAMNALIKRKEANAKEKARIDHEIAILEAKINKKPPPPEAPAKSLLQKFAEEYNVKIAQSLTDKNKNTLPAMFQYVHPDNGNDSAQIDIALSVSHDVENPWRIPISAGLTSEYHYNNAARKLQDSLALGGKIDAVLGPNTEYGQLVRGSIAYKRDNLVSGEGVLADLIWFVSIPGLHLGGFQWNWGNFLTGRIEPFLGLQDESGNGASTTFKDGNRFSLRAGISLKASLFPSYLANRLDLDISESYWRHLTTSGGFNLYSKDQAYFVESVTYWLNTGSDPNGRLQDNEKHFGISANYTYGDNPSTSQFDADTWTFGLSVLF
jgi:hypothetical protein